MTKVHQIIIMLGILIGLGIIGLIITLFVNVVKSNLRKHSYYPWNWIFLVGILGSALLLILYKP